MFHPRAAVVTWLRPVMRRWFGHDLVPLAKDEGLATADFTEEDRQVLKAVGPYTMTSRERIVALCQAVRYVVQNGIPGAFVECGVWKGGSMMAVALTLLGLDVTDRKLYLFDTFEGMAPPSAVDVDVYHQSAEKVLTSAAEGLTISLDAVRDAVLSVAYPADKILFVKGRVENTIPDSAPNAIALLRLDTDWYESTRHELTHLFPRITSHGVLIIDDYGHWQGARRAVDEYFASVKQPILLNRIDYTGRIAVKPYA